MPHRSEEELAELTANPPARVPGDPPHLRPVWWLGGDARTICLECACAGNKPDAELCVNAPCMSSQRVERGRRVGWVIYERIEEEQNHG